MSRIETVSRRLNLIRLFFLFFLRYCIFLGEGMGDVDDRPCPASPSRRSPHVWSLAGQVSSLDSSAAPLSPPAASAASSSAAAEAAALDVVAAVTKLRRWDWAR